MIATDVEQCLRYNTTARFCNHVAVFAHSLWYVQHYYIRVCVFLTTTGHVLLGWSSARSDDRASRTCR